MNLSLLFSTSERIEILRAVVFLEKEFRVSETAKKLKVSKGLVSKYFGILMKEKLLSRKGGNKLIVENNVSVKSIKLVLNLLAVNMVSFKKFGFVKAAGLYGSCAQGANTESSDLDLWVLTGKAQDMQLAGFSAEVKKKLPKARLFFLTKEKLEALKKSDSLFYNSLFFGSIIVYGAENAL